MARLSVAPLARSSAGSSVRTPALNRAIRVSTAVLWLSVAVVHGVCSGYYTCVAFVYHELPKTALSVYVRANQLSIDAEHYPVIVAFNAACSAIHGVKLLTMVFWSVRRRELSFHRTAADERDLNASPDHLRRTRCSFGRARDAWRCLFGFSGIFGVGNKQYARLLLLQEVCETVLQSLQAYNLSTRATSRWLNRLASLVVSVSCWATPALQRLLPASPRLELILCLLVDIALDFVSSIGVPIAFAAHYLSAYDPVATNFREAAWQDKLWVTQMNTELKLLFIQSWAGFAFSSLFAVILFFSLDDIKLLASAPDANFRSVDPRFASVKMQLAGGASWSRRVTMLVQSALVLWGCVVLGLHVSSASEQAVLQCLLQVRPWLRSKPACVYMNIDCKSLPEPAESAERLDAALRGIDTAALETLVFRNCPTFRMPETVRAFSSLVAVYLYDLKLVDWPETVALTRTYHPTLRHLGMYGVDLSAFGNGASFPPGLLAPDFPPTLGTVTLMECGLVDLPATLDATWPGGINMLIRTNPLQRVPGVLLRMNLVRLSLQSNQIRQLPAQVFEMHALQWLDVRSNPLQELPRHVRRLGASLATFDFSHTNVSALPDWMLTPSFRAQVAANASMTPLCGAAHSRTDPAAVFCH